MLFYRWRVLYEPQCAHLSPRKWYGTCDVLWQSLHSVGTSRDESSAGSGVCAISSSISSHVDAMSQTDAQQSGHVYPPCA